MNDRLRSSQPQSIANGIRGAIPKRGWSTDTNLLLAAAYMFYHISRVYIRLYISKAWTIIDTGQCLNNVETQYQEPYRRSRQPSRVSLFDYFQDRRLSRSIWEISPNYSKVSRTTIRFRSFFNFPFRVLMTQQQILSELGAQSCQRSNQQSTEIRSNPSSSERIYSVKNRNKRRWGGTGQTSPKSALIAILVASPFSWRADQIQSRKRE